MKLFQTFLPRLFPIVLIAALFAACDETVSEFGSEIISGSNIDIDAMSFPVLTYNSPTKPMQTNGLSNNILGDYSDALGRVTASVVSQVSPLGLDPNFGDNVVLDSVVLMLPYHSRVGTVDDDGNSSYTLDSLYGSNALNLAIYKSDFFLRTFNPSDAFNSTQRYYSDGNTSDMGQVSRDLLEADLLYEAEDYYPSNEGITLVEIDEVNEDTTRTNFPPALRVHLNTEVNGNENYWEDLIFSKEDSQELGSVNNFHDYFRGIYFKVTSLNGDQGHLQQLNFSSSSATLSLYYTYETTTTDSDGAEITSEVQGAYQMNFAGNRVNLVEDDLDPGVAQQINSADEINGDENLFLKGGVGSMAVVKLFEGSEDGQTFADYMSDFKETDAAGNVVTKRLINEAYLEFFINEDYIGESVPRRIFLFDIENNIPLADYFTDQTFSSDHPDGKLTHLPALDTITTDAGVEMRRFKVRLTQHINNIITNDSTNVALGLAMVANVGDINLYECMDQSGEVNRVPSSAILSPESLVLSGTQAPLPQRVQLKIYYTESN